MICLGIESTAHTFAASLVSEKEFISDEQDSHTTEEGGMIPRELAEHHTKVCLNVLKRAIVKKPDLVAFSQGPGIGHALRIGAVAARALSYRYNTPLIGVNHCIAHLEIARRLTGFEDPIMLYVSGGNTQVIGFESGRYRIFGETLDIGVGNLLDTFGRGAGIGFPAGPEIEKIAKETGYIGAVTTSPGRKYPNDDPYALKRTRVSMSADNLFVFRIKTSGYHLFIKERRDED